MRLETCLNFAAYGVHDHLFCAVGELAILNDELFEYGPLWCLVIFLAPWVRKRNGSFCACPQPRLMVDLGPQLKEELS